MSVTDQLSGLSGSAAMKVPVRIATTANITLSGLQTIDGVTTVAGDRVLVKNQTDATENGIYVAGASAWARATDWNGARDVVGGTLVLSAEGTANVGGLWRVTGSGVITVGTSEANFTGFVAESGIVLDARNAANAAVVAGLGSGSYARVALLDYEADSSFDGTNDGSSGNDTFDISAFSDLSQNGVKPAGPVVYDYHFGATEGGNVAAAIQSAIDFSIYGSASDQWARRPVEVLTKSGTLESPLHACYGDTDRHGVVMSGVGRGYAAVGNHPSSILAHEILDDVALNVQGARNARIEGFTFYCASVTTDLTANLDFTNADFFDPANWDARYTALAASNGRYNPMAHMAVDARGGAAPSPAYPDATYPAFRGTVAQYNKQTSSQVLFYNNEYRGGVVGVAIQPADVDANGDFVEILDCYFAYLKYGISVGNAQARITNFSRCLFANVHTCIVANEHGKQVGKVAATIEGITGSNVFQIFNWTRGAFVGPVVITGSYFETTARIGEITGGTSSGIAPLIIEGLTFNAIDLTGGLATVVSSLIFGVANDPIIIEGGRYLVPSVAAFTGQHVRANATSVRRDTAPAKAYEALAHNAIAGFSANPSFNPEIIVAHDRYSAASPSTISDTVLCDSRNPVTGRDTNVCHWQTDGYTTTADGGKWTDKQMFAVSVAQGSRTSVSRSNRAVTFTNSLITSAHAAYQLGLMPGCVLHDVTSATIMYVRSTDTGTGVMICEMQNNYTETSSGVFGIWDSTFDPTTGNFEAINGLNYVPERTMTGDIIAGSVYLINVVPYGGVFPSNMGLTDGDYFATKCYSGEIFEIDDDCSIQDVTVPAAVNVSGVTAANPGVVTTSTAHGFIDGQMVEFDNVGGMTELNGNIYRVVVASSTTFQLGDANWENVDTSGFTAYTSGGTVTPIGAVIELGAQARETRIGADLNFWIRAAPANEAAR